MKKILGLFAIVLGLTGCSMNVPTQMFSTQNKVEESPQNKVEWIITNTESRSASTTLETGTLEYVTLEVYKVPNKEGKFIHDEKELLETKKLYRGEVLTFPSSKDYDYKYITCIKIIEFNRYNAFYAKKNEITFFDYEGTIGIESSHYYACQLRTSNTEAYGDTAGHKIWKMGLNYVTYRDDLEGYENYYYFLDNNVIEKFYEEHKDGGRIEWNN